MRVEKESFEYELEKRENIEIRTDCGFTVYKLCDSSFAPIGPDSLGDRFYSAIFEKGDVIFIDFEGNCSIEAKEVANTMEIPSGEKLVEIIPEEEMSLYDRLRGEMMQYLSDMSDKRGDESFEEANDFDIDDEDYDIPLTPYEYNDMIEEYPGQDEGDALTSSSDQQAEAEQTSEVMDEGAAAPSHPSDEQKTA